MLYSHFLKIFIAVVLALGLPGAVAAQKKDKGLGNIPPPLNPVRPNKKHGPKVEKFLDQAERYWHVFHNNLSETAYEFLADTPNRLLDAVLLPNKGWYIQGQYRGRYEIMPSGIEKSHEEEGNSLDTLAIAPNGGWVMLSSKKEEGDYVQTPGAKDLRPYNFSNRQIERRRAGWNRIPEKLSDELQRLYDEWIYIDLVRFTAKGEWVLIYHKQGQCGFGFTTSDGIDPQFYKALFNLWSKGVPIRDIAFWGDNGYAIIVNEIGYIAENVPDKVRFALEDLRKHGASSWRTTRIASAFDGRWLIFLRDSGGAPNATCYEDYPVENRLGYPKSEVPLGQIWPPSKNNIAFNKPVSIVTNGADDTRNNCNTTKEITDGILLLSTANCSSDGVVGFQNNDYNQMMQVTVRIDLQQTYNVTKIRYTQGNVHRAETWNADIIITPFGRSPTTAGSSFRGSWTEQAGSITTSIIEITLQKTRKQWEEDWLYIGEIEVIGTPCRGILTIGGVKTCLN